MVPEQRSRQNDSLTEPLESGEKRGYWRYFSDRADTLKDNLWKQVTWLLGLAGALYVYIVDQELISWSIDGRLLIKESPVLLLGLAGVVLCIFALLLIWDTGTHIKSNLWRQTHFSNNIPLLKEMFDAETNAKGEAKTQPPKEPSSSEASVKSTEDKERWKRRLPLVFRQFEGLPPVCKNLFALVTGFMVLFALCILAAIAQMTT